MSTLLLSYFGPMFVLLVWLVINELTRHKLKGLAYKDAFVVRQLTLVAMFIPLLNIFWLWTIIIVYLGELRDKFKYL